MSADRRCTCAWCGATFRTRYPGQQYCCRTHRQMDQSDAKRAAVRAASERKNALFSKRQNARRRRHDSL